MFVALALVAAAQDHLVSLGHGAFDTRWNEDCIAMASGSDYALLLLSDGTLRVSGYPYRGPLTPPAGVFTQVDTAGYSQHNGALRIDGTIEIWGQDLGRLLPVPQLPPGTTYVEFDVGERHAVAIRSDGVAVTWGANISGQLDLPPLPVGLTYLHASCGSDFTLAVRSDGQIVGAGENGLGQITPPPLPSGKTYVGVDAGAAHALAMRSDGVVVPFGAPWDRDPPVLPAGMTYTSFQVEGPASCAQRSDGALVLWGALGTFTNGVYHPPAGLSFTKYARGENIVLALRSDGRLVGLGKGLAFDSNFAGHSLGKQRMAIQFAVENEVPELHPAYVARCDDGTFEQEHSDLLPLPPPPGMAFVDLALGRHGMIALKNDGLLQFMGSNLDLRFPPTPPAGTRFTAVFSRLNHALALASDGSLTGWGANASGQVSVPALPAGASYLGAACGDAHSLAVRSDGALLAFGSNTFGQCDVPALPPGTGYVEAWAGRDFSLARRSDGALVAFGRNDLGQCDVPPLAPGLSYLELACGHAHVAALRGDGVVVLWGTGRRPAGEIPPPGGGLAYVELAAAGDETIARLAPELPASGPILARVEPAVIESLLPGTDQSITLHGIGFDTVTSVTVDGQAVPAASWTIVSASAITLDMPQVAGLGAHRIGVSDGVATHERPVTLVAPLVATYELGSGDLFNVVDRDDGLRLRMGGPVGKVQFLYASLSNVPSTNAWVSLALGNNFTELESGGGRVVPASGWLEMAIQPASLPLPAPSGMTFYSQTILFRAPKPFPTSNLQSFVLVP